MHAYFDLCLYEHEHQQCTLVYTHCARLQSLLRLLLLLLDALRTRQATAIVLIANKSISTSNTGRAVQNTR
eukprot:16369-Heterococcus_DN1.PRE.2